MGALVVTKTSPAGSRVEIDIQELTLRLKSLTEGCNIEVVQLAILSMLDEIAEAAGNSRET